MEENDEIEEDLNVLEEEKPRRSGKIFGDPVASVDFS